MKSLAFTNVTKAASSADAATLARSRATYNFSLATRRGDTAEIDLARSALDLAHERYVIAGEELEDAEYAIWEEENPRNPDVPDHWGCNDLDCDICV